MAFGLYRAVRYLSIGKSHLLKTFFFGCPPPENFLPALVNIPCFEQTNLKHKNLIELLRESLLWAVPKKRRSVEKRRCRKYGWPKYFYKMLVPKTNLLICPKCGSHREAGLLCSFCYARIKEQTTEMQSAIKEKLGISPAESEIVVLYQDDERLNPEFYEGKRILEIKKDRPKIFSDNLLQRSTQGLSNTQEINQKK